MKRIFMFMLSFIIFFSISCGSTPSNYSTYIKSVHDGDTFRDINNNQYRLYGVDTAEISDQYNHFKPTTGMEYLYAYEAKVYVSKLILKKEVKVSLIATDPYQRKVARINIGNKDLSYLLVKKGLARVSYIDIIPGSKYYTSDFNYYKNLLIIQKWAHDNEKGFWIHQDQFNIIFPKAKHSVLK